VRSPGGYAMFVVMQSAWQCVECSATPKAGPAALWRVTIKINKLDEWAECVSDAVRSGSS